MDTVHYKLISGDDVLNKALKIRHTVFFEEQGIPEELDVDGNDSSALHILAEYQGKPAGTARIRHTTETQVKLERMAVLKPLRGSGIGTGIVSCAEEVCRTKGITAITLNAQQSAVSFYRACGFSETGLPFQEAGITHVRMDKALRGD